MLTLNIQQLYTLLTSNAVAVGTSAIQVSGGTGSLAALGNNPANRNRQSLRITNTALAGGGNIYIGAGSGITATNGGGWFQVLAPGQMYEELSKGSVPRYIIGSSATCFAQVEEYQ